MTPLEAAVIEWRDARQAIFDGRGKCLALLSPKDWAPLWQRHDEATDALFALAKTLGLP